MKQTPSPLSRFEMAAQQLVEGSFARLFRRPRRQSETFAGRLLLVDVAGHLARAMEDGQQDGMAPDRYRITLNPEQVERLTAVEEPLQDQLVGYLLALAEQTGVLLQQRPQVTFAGDPQVGRQQVQVTAGYSEQVDEVTHARPAAKAVNGEDQALALAALQAADAYLIVAGRHHVPLRRPVINIGRRQDNDVVVDHPNVSRHHAQLRWRFGHFVIYDLDSRGGTAVNNQIVSECVLHPGDVIHLSTEPLIYGEGSAEGAEDAAAGGRTQTDEVSDVTMAYRPPKNQ